ncbi:MAG TPA: rhodanese-like domain-containing protein [Woeseiaceae bacterium]|nr:rhodanese-like domain-containing protein [Woeseiaceae bacterium]
MQASGTVNVVSFYRFVDIEAPTTLRDPLLALCGRQALRGTILLATEGYNGTLAGSRAGIDAVFAWLRARLHPDAAVAGRRTHAAAAPFQRMKVRVKPEIVSLGRPDIRPQAGTGLHVPPARWHALLDDPATLLIDTRNRYEVALGTFPRALDPGTDSFRQFPQFAASLRDADRERPVAMFCTGGIRCEKASALLRDQGFRRVYQLDGGILNYLEQVEPAEQRWQGECFVFDERVAIRRRDPE